ncbi:hypothetical protein [Streptomyces sp. NPDC051684]|uniref:hypothetical protein n=1 Tax=Streptomyces sp. NPDC051684 TaxID=3365670 RepID=UPI00378A5AEA
MIDDEKPQDMAAEVVRAEPPTLLENTLGTDLLRWELAPTATGTRLTLRHTVRDRDWIPKVAAGWRLGRVRKVVGALVFSWCVVMS